jgi:hypothetical protein
MDAPFLKAWGSIVVAALFTATASPIVAQRTWNLETSARVGAVSESWIRPQGVNGPWLGLSRSRSVGAAIRVGTPLEQLRLRTLAERTFGGGVLERQYAGPRGCNGGCRPSGYSVADLSASAATTTLSVAAEVRTLSVGPIDVLALGGLATRHTAIAADAAQVVPQSELGGLTWGWYSGLGFAIRRGETRISLEITRYDEAGSRSLDSPATVAHALDRWHDQTLGLTVSLRPWGSR